MECKKLDCQYRCKICFNLEFCDYIGYTGKSRGCDARNCDKYVKRYFSRQQGVSVDETTGELVGHIVKLIEGEILSEKQEEIK